MIQVALGLALLAIAVSSMLLKKLLEFLGNKNGCFFKKIFLQNKY